MSKLDKDQVVAEFTAAYEAAFGKPPQLEQKPGWFSVDGGKNIRLAELADLGARYSADKAAKKTTAKTKPAAQKKAAPAKAAKPAKKPTKKSAAKAAKTKSGNGQSAADIWATQLDDKQRLPRGCR